MKIVIALIALTLLNVSSAQFSSSGGFQFGSNFGFPNPLDFALSASRFFADQFSSGIERLRQAQTGIQSAFDGAFSDFRQRFDDLRQAGQNFSEEIRHRALEQLEESRRQALEANRQFQENLSRQESLIRDRIRQLESSGRSGSAERRRYYIELSQIQQQIAQLREQERQLGFTFEFNLASEIDLMVHRTRLEETRLTFRFRKTELIPTRGTKQRLQTQHFQTTKLDQTLAVKIKL